MVVNPTPDLTRAGHTWDSDGAAIPVPADHAPVLARLPDSGFTIVEITPPASPETVIGPTAPILEAATGDPAKETTSTKSTTCRGARAKPAVQSLAD